MNNEKLIEEHDKLYNEICKDCMIKVSKLLELDRELILRETG